MKELICIVCPRGCRLKVDDENGYTVTGNSCERGREYGKNELVDPRRTVTSTVAISGGLHERLPVKTDRTVKKADVFAVMNEVAKVHLDAPVKCGQIIIENVAGTGANLVSAKDVEKIK